MKTSPEPAEPATARSDERPGATPVTETQRLCWACFAELPGPEASICLRCNSPQGWRRYVVISDTSLSLLIALLSVVTVSAPTLLNMLRADREDVRVVFTGLDANGEARLFAFNAGTRPGVIAPRGHAVQVVQAFSEAGLGERSVSMAMPVSFWNADTPEETGILVAPGGSVLMRMSVGSHTLWTTVRRDQAQCWLEVTTAIYGVESQYRRGRSVDAAPRHVRVVLQTKGLLDGECLLIREEATSTGTAPSRPPQDVR